MLRRFKLHPAHGMSPAALIVAVLALVVATSTGAVLAAGKIGTGGLKKGAVTSAKIRNHTIRKQDISADALAQLKGATGREGQRGATGATGPAGPAGAKGDTGPAGPQGVRGAQGVQGGPGPANTETTSANSGANGVTNTPAAVVGHWHAAGTCGAYDPAARASDSVQLWNDTKSYRIVNSQTPDLIQPPFVGLVNFSSANPDELTFQGVIDDGSSAATVVASRLWLDTTHCLVSVTLSGSTN